MDKVNMYGVTAYGKDEDSAAFSRAADGTWLMYYRNCSVQLDPGSFLVALLEDRAALDDELRSCRAEVAALKVQIAAVPNHTPETQLRVRVLASIRLSGGDLYAAYTLSGSALDKLAARYGLVRHG